MELLLGQYKNKRSTNNDNYIGVDLFREDGLLHNDIITETIDEYQQYIKEKDESNKYRLIFTINPLCSNVLFNPVTEIVYKEGSDECIFFGVDGNQSAINTINNISRYRSYKGLTTTTSTKLTRHDAIEDTSYSHKQIGPLVYHCGFDIFNNHTLRKKEFMVVNKVKSGLATAYKTPFNTLRDYVRDRTGSNVSDHVVGLWLRWFYRNSSYIYKPLRAYMSDTTYSFAESISNNLMEKDGWFGFSNPSGLDIINVDMSSYGKFSVNKCMNNNKSCEFIDMYPDRSLFSFIPKVNTYRNRIEPNWEYCLTFPYREHYNDIVQNINKNVNGLKCKLVTNINDSEFFDVETYLTFRTDIKSNFSMDNVVEFTIINNDDDTVITVPLTILVKNVGLDGYDTDHYFSIRYEDISEYMDDLSARNIEVRVRKVINGTPCKYYFRVFKRIPNFKNTDVYVDDAITDEEIEKYCMRNFNSSMNKIAFERTIYNDNVAQIVFNDDIDLTGIRDNLNRPLTEVYLTIVKCNGGYSEWYNDKNYRSSAVTFSHCFGKLTAGLDLPTYANDYNVHKIHNVRITDTVQEQKEFKKANLKKILNIDVDNTPLNLEEDNGEITIDGDTIFENKGEFLGDIVEFTMPTLSEVVLEDVYFRFNTAQRECTNYTITHGKDRATVAGEYANIEYDEIQYDLYDEILRQSNTNDANFIERHIYNVNDEYDSDYNITYSEAYPANISPEGYYYKAHYGLKIRELDTALYEGYHTRVTYSIAYDENGNELKTRTPEGYYRFTIKTNKNYYFNPNEKVLLYPKNRNADGAKDLTCTIYSVEGDNFDIITLNLPDEISTGEKLKSYSLYKYNSEKPYYAHEYNDGTGRYIWREIKSENKMMAGDELFNSIFVNGAHYFEKGINFFLRRQDPICAYGLSYCDGVNSHVLNLVMEGEYKDVSSFDYVGTTDENVSIC